MRIDFSSINLDNKKIKDLQKYTLWYNFFSFWMFAWFMLYMLKIIKIQPPLLFYYLTIVFILIEVNYNTSQDRNNIVRAIQVISAIILDIVPIYFLSGNNLLNNKSNILILIYGFIYLIFIKLRFKSENILKVLFDIYFNYNNISVFNNITVRKYFKLKYNL
tara:strand:- start:1768 stop:2253 length:486 start_codon:yes stop_codon:yes gene_type:complete